MDKTIVEKTIIEEQKTVVENPEKTLIEKKPSKETTASIKQFQGKKIIKEFTAEGGEADLFLLENGTMLKLYRKGIVPKMEVVQKIKEVGERLPDDVVKILDFGIDEETGRFYEIQEYMEKGNIKKLLKGKTPDKNLLRQIIYQTNQILKALHSLNIIHRDIKPSNILVKEENPLNLVITDFGISSLLDGKFSKKITTVKGTPIYSAPESFSGIMGKEADYWSFGMVILDLLNKNPFKGLDPKTIMFKITSESIPIPKELDEDIKLLLKGLLTQNRKKRWGAKEVDLWLSGKTPQVHYEEKTPAGNYVFNNKEYNSLEELAEAMQSDKQTFEYATVFVQRGHLNTLLTENRLFDLETKLWEMLEKERDPEVSLTEAIHLIAPSVEIKPYGINANPVEILENAAGLIKGKSTANPLAQMLISGNVKDLEKFTKMVKYTKHGQFLTMMANKFIEAEKSLGSKTEALNLFASMLSKDFVITKKIDFSRKKFIDTLKNPMTKDEYDFFSDQFKRITGKSLSKKTFENINMFYYLKTVELVRKDKKHLENTQPIDKNLKVKTHLYPFEIALASWKAKSEKIEDLIDAVSAAVSVEKSGVKWQPLERKRISKIKTKLKELDETGYIVPLGELDLIEQKQEKNSYKVKISQWPEFINHIESLEEFLEDEGILLY
ncbi:protein kinase domain-containing protein [Persephonella sp.]